MSKVQIERVETVIVDLPLRRQQRFAAIGASTTAIVLVKIWASGGIVGIGEGCTPSGPWWSGESVESIKLNIDAHIAPLIIGRDVFDLRGISAEVDRKLFGNPFAKATVEMALLDIQGKIAGVPVHDLLGGKQRSSLPCSWPLATGDPGEEIEEAKEHLAQKRFKLFKLKMGFLEPETDVARACAIAKALEGKASVRVDPNESWDEATCKWAMPRMADAGIAMVEQPMARWNVDGFARITAQTKMATAVDESLCTMDDALRLGRMHTADLVSIKVMKHGGLTNARRIADIAIASGMSIYMGTFLECSIGTAAGMQLAATFSDLPYGGELSGANLIAEDIAVRPARYENFELQLEEGVGLAAEVDEDKVEALRRDRSRLSIAV
ncbi:muconate cycloisomerase family protein [Alterisphingorhabdus coralli]|uniref:Muconate cycloisomerase family protein n=1 Tax=Alterisphingorhabdus coralli TaxID=3071408 RepID=A0AA97F8B3_9SPHN|nr:muconate cycloisomerase family protein [Parasphingorhabdus sp. SCSIO 66989]WOE75351.1 muconate cycloisomerase family protein [Parasphingorhabdus sp. SCSIO 66989]